MDYNILQNNDLKLSSIGLGTWVFDGGSWSGTQDHESLSAIHAAIDLGINLIDTAPIYGAGRSEKIVGVGIKGKRDKVVIATKCGLLKKGNEVIHDLKPHTIVKEVQESLKRLQTDYIDIYQCHHPDPSTPLEDTLEQLVKLKDQGKIRYIGLSNYSIEDIKFASKYCQIVSLQHQYSLLNRDIESDILPFAKEKGIGVLTYGVLAGGILSGKYKEVPKFPNNDARKFFYPYYQEDKFLKIKDFMLNNNFNKPFNEVAINWVRSNNAVSSVLIGARNKTQVESNVLALQWDLSEEDRGRLLFEF